MGGGGTSDWDGEPWVGLRHKKGIWGMKQTKGEHVSDESAGYTNTVEHKGGWGLG